jgi:hypothetical protein
VVVALGRERESRGLRAGDVVEVRSAAEIMSTLDGRAATESMPFMPEMLQYVGRRFTVSRRVEKICDTAGKISGEPSVSRRMRSTVYLDDLRCDGSAHGGCQAGCRLYWKEDWLKVVDVDADAEAGAGESSPAGTELARLVDGSTRRTRIVDGREREVFRCQATEARAASEPMSASDPRQHVREVTVGNVSATRVASVLGRYAISSSWVNAKTAAARVLARLGLRTVRGSSDQTGGVVRQLRKQAVIKPGDVVRIRPLEEITRTLVNGKHRGLWFDVPEMSTFCGGTYTVKDRVKRFIDDRNGEMIELKSDCLILDDVCCTGEHSSRRWFCPRGIYPFWREDWLEMVEQAPAHPEARVAT